jgi:YD repeat-containing protein
MTLKCKLVFIALFLLILSVRGQQPINADPTKGFYNVTLPKTPESEGMEQFGKIPVNELTGTPDISFPIYTLKSNFLTLPITLAYHATGIKVNQEASWVGLGWDLDAGGRITVETKGDLDKWSTNVGLTAPSPSSYASGISAIYARLRNSNNQPILTAATPCTVCFPINDTTCPSCFPPYNIPDDYRTVSDMTQLGVGEPDIFRASFMGHSFAFFFDKVTGNLTFKGEQSTFKIQPSLDGFGFIASFVITDNDGVIYYFDQQEKTTLTLQTNVTQVPTTTSAWLLTKVVHPSGDYIQFNYANFGNSYPMLSISGFISDTRNGGTNTWTQSQSAGGQNQTILSPWYLTSIQSPDVEVDFFLGGRNDIYGPGSQRLDQVSVKERNSGTMWKTAKFNYSYFTASANPYLSSFAGFMNVSDIPSSDYLACHNIRLRLDGLTVNNLPPYQFFYNTTTIDKLSYSQDHWGYYNGAANYHNQANPVSLIPATGVASSLGFSQFEGTAIRDCNPSFVQAMTLQTIIYPTGGSTIFEFEPHQGRGASQTFTGGGLRIKNIKNYASGGALTNSVGYSYTLGVFFGLVNYWTEIFKYAASRANPGPASDQLNMTSSGYSNDNELSIAYSAVTVTNTGSDGQSNGKIVKVFNVSIPYYNFEVRVPAWPTVSPNILTTQFLDLSKSMFPPGPAGNLDGKLMQEQYLDNNGNQVRIVNHYYHQANYSQNFYDIRAVDNVGGGIGMTQAFFGENGWRAASIYVSPNKTYTTVQDSLVQIDYLNGVSVTDRKYYTYNSLYQLQSEQHFASDGTSTTTSYQYPFDRQDLYPAPQMLAAHIYSPVLTTTVTRSGSPVNYIYQNYTSPYTNIFVPNFTQVQIAGNPVETRYLYTAYDVQGHLLERQMPNGVKEDFLWGYGQRFPVSKVVGSDISTVVGLVNGATLSSPPSDDALRTELNKIRTGLPNALVNTYTYNVFNGLTSQTDPTGVTNYYNYDGYGRLSYIQDQHHNIVKRFAYSYTGTPDGAADVLTTPLNAINTTLTSWTATFTNITTGASTNFVVNQGTVPTVFANLAPGLYSIALNPIGTLNTFTYLTFNGVTTQQTAFTLNNVNLSSPATFNLVTGPLLPGFISMNSGYSAPSSGFNNNGGTVTGHLTWLSHSTLNSGVTYTIGTVNNNLVPTVNRPFPVTDGAGRSWNVTITSSGDVQVSCGATIPANTTITFASITYSI